MPDNPWTNLSAGFRDARRIDQEGRWDFFWWLSETGAPALLLVMPGDVEELRPLPSIKSLTVRYQPSKSGKALAVILDDHEQIELFSTFCRDVVEAAESAKDCQQALVLTIRRMLRWHYLLRGGAPDRLSKEEQRGLIGELHFLEVLIERFGTRAAIEAWTGPEGSAKDFEMSGLCVEVKARRGAARPWVLISSEDQLSDVDGSDLVLRVSVVDSAIKPEGMTLTDWVKRVEGYFASSDIEAHGLWEQAILATGFDWTHDYTELRWSVGQTHHFEVSDGFPRISVPVPDGVMNVRYAISIQACAPFEMDTEEFEQSLSMTGISADG